MLMTVLKWLPLTLLIGAHSIGAVLGQGCHAVLVAVGASDRRCLAPGAGETFRDCDDCPAMVVVPAGSFTMGSPAVEPERAGEREDQVRVRIAQPFAVGAFAVTRGEFAVFAAATGHRPDGCCYVWTGTTWEERSDRSWQTPGFVQDDRHPVTCVSLADANAYVAWLSAATGKTYRLPSEAEREYATRAGTATAFWWGASIATAQANYDGRGASALGQQGEWRQHPVRVDSFRANPWGLYNVHGNVWDWTSDCWNEANAGNPGDGTARTDGDCTWRAVRGGAWNYGATYIRAAFRYWNLPGNRSGVQGLRVVRVL